MSEALRLAGGAWGQTLNVDDELGDGFTLVKKDEIEGLPMIIMEWAFRKSTENGGQRPYVSVRAAVKLKNGQLWKVIFNDGSAPGIAEQLATLTKKHNRYGGVTVPQGIRRSDYEGPNGPATSWYLR